jgi:hypothetical protein
MVTVRDLLKGRTYRLNSPLIEDDLEPEVLGNLELNHQELEGSDVYSASLPKAYQDGGTMYTGLTVVGTEKALIVSLVA